MLPPIGTEIHRIFYVISIRSSLNIVKLEIVCIWGEIQIFRNNPNKIKVNKKGGLYLMGNAISRGFTTPPTRLSLDKKQIASTYLQLLSQ